jgi:hypothetical protein
MPVQRCVLGGAGRSGVTAGETGLVCEALTRHGLDEETVLERFDGFRHMLGRADRTCLP